jgi:hypothetical protein
MRTSAHIIPESSWLAVLVPWLPVRSLLNTVILYAIHTHKRERLEPSGASLRSAGVEALI